MEKEKKTYGVSFGGLLLLMFIGLKLTGHINWSWWWVLTPAWLPLAIIISCYAILFLGALIKGVSVRLNSKKGKGR